MDEIILRAKELRKDIDNLPEIKEYYRLKILYENDEELRKMRKEIARLCSLHKEEEKKNLLNIYNNYPLVNNYEATKEEAQKILLAIKNIIE